MVSKNDGKWVIWPIYFDKSISRKNGRKVAKKNAIDKPLLENIVKAAKSLGLNPIIEKDNSHPKNHWKKHCRVLVVQTKSKSKILENLANRM